MRKHALPPGWAVRLFSLRRPLNTLGDPYDHKETLYFGSCIGESLIDSRHGGSAIVHKHGASNEHLQKGEMMGSDGRAQWRAPDPGSILVRRKSVAGSWLPLLVWVVLVAAVPRFAAGQEVVVEINDTASESDDYFCWSPVAARVKLVQPGINGLPVMLQGAGEANAGAVWFQASVGSRPTAVTFAPTDTLPLTLPADGSWVSFWVAGKRPSKGDRDVEIVVSNAQGQDIGRHKVMVRVRKDAEKMEANEIEHFLTSLAKLHDLQNGVLASKYSKHSRAHDEAFQMGIHGGPNGMPLFLAWHRAFLMALERELQQIDPRVSLPYWRFDRPAPKLFTPTFIGTISGGASAIGGFLVVFDATNPIRGWHMADGRGALVRARDASTSGPIPANRLSTLFGNPQNDIYGGINGDAELLYHNGAHSFILGWLGTGSSPRDPLFYLLHANVDRAWAQWQAKFNKLSPNPQDVTVYSGPGVYPGASSPNRFRKGSYADDAMWPWSGSGGNQGTPDAFDDWPPFAYSLEGGPQGAGPSNPPTPISMVDYLDVNGRGNAHWACYDDIDYFGQIVP